MNAPTTVDGGVDSDERADQRPRDEQASCEAMERWLDDGGGLVLMIVAPLALGRPPLHGSLLSSPLRFLFAPLIPHPLALVISDAGANDAHRGNLADCMLAQLSV